MQTKSALATTIGRIRLPALSLVCFFMIQPVGAQSVEGVHSITKIADSVFVATPRFGGANATIILNSDYVIVVDPHSDPATASALVEEITRLTGNPIRYVVNTHWHGDHHGGNRYIVESSSTPVTVVAHQNTARDITQKSTPDLREMGSFYATFGRHAQEYLEENDGVNGRTLTDDQRRQITSYISANESFVGSTDRFEYYLPDSLITEGLSLGSPSFPVDISAIGRPAHTEGDIVVYLPEQKILIAGDLLTAPYVVPRSGYPESYAMALRSIAEMDVESYVLGHGGPVKSDRNFLYTMVDFLEACSQFVRRTLEASKSVEQTIEASQTDESLLAFRDRIDWNEPGLRFLDMNSLIAMTVERSYIELTAGL